MHSCGQPQHYLDGTEHDVKNGKPTAGFVFQAVGTPRGDSDITNVDVHDKALLLEGRLKGKSDDDDVLSRAIEKTAQFDQSKTKVCIRDLKWVNDAMKRSVTDKMAKRQGVESLAICCSAPRRSEIDMDQNFEIIWPLEMREVPQAISNTARVQRKAFRVTTHIETVKSTRSLISSVGSLESIDSLAESYMDLEENSPIIQINSAIDAARSGRFFYEHMCIFLRYRHNQGKLRLCGLRNSL